MGVMKTVKISVIVPVYKVEGYLSRCVDSILAQTFTTLEVILVDDGSPDGCGRICDEYAMRDGRVKVVHQLNAGVTAARRRGLEEARGEFVCFVDADDYLPENSFQILYETARGEDLDMVMGSYEEVSEEGEVLKEVCYCQQRYESKKFVEFMSMGLNTAPWGCLYREKLFDAETLKISSDIKRGEDLIMKIRLALKAKRIKVISEIVYCYVQRNMSVIHTFRPTFEYWKFYYSHFSFYVRDNADSEWVERTRVRYALYLLRTVLTDEFDPHDPWLLELREAVRRLGFPLKKRLYLRLFTSPAARRVILFARRHHLKDRLQACLGRGKRR